MLTPSGASVTGQTLIRVPHFIRHKIPRRLQHFRSVFLLVKLLCDGLWPDDLHRIIRISVFRRLSRPLMRPPKSSCLLCESRERVAFTSPSPVGSLSLNAGDPLTFLLYCSATREQAPLQQLCQPQPWQLVCPGKDRGWH